MIDHAENLDQVWDEIYQSLTFKQAGMLTAASRHIRALERDNAKLRETIRKWNG